MQHLNKAKYTANIIKTAIQKKRALSQGYDDRARMLEDYKNGVTPTGHRVEWILRSSNKVISLLVQLAQEFNAQYPNDRCSVHDLCDVLATTNAKIKKKL